MKTNSGFFAALRRSGGILVFAALCLVLAAAGPVLAGGPYLTPGHPDGLALLPPPPAAGSAEEAADLAEVVAVFNGRTPQEEAAAKREETFTIFAFTPAIGTNFQPGRFPKTEALFTEVAKEAKAIGDVKSHYKRPRPFLLDKRVLLGEPETGFSYPSGHSTMGTLDAALLAELFPDHAEAILAEGRDAGWHRVLTGKHYPTDIFAGRVMGRAIARELEANEAFKHDFAECAAEVSGAGIKP